MAQHLAALGYACFTVEYRLSTEALYPAAVYDLKTAIQWMRIHAATYNIDTNKIATLGFSAGGQLSALMGTTGGHPDFAEMYKSKTYTHPELLSKTTQSVSDKVNGVIDMDGILAFIHPESGEG